MQQTRLNTLFNTIGSRITELFSNPWRRIALILISLLFGIFLGSAISTTAGQDAKWDVLVAGMLILFTETISRFAYSRNRQIKSLWWETLNVFKIGLTYSLYLEAFKLGS
jgi:Na+-transporting NADH:ubiquinone oxidoreductase subunit NqrB